MCHSFFTEAARRFKGGDKLAGTGARAKVGSTELKASDLRNLSFNEQGTLLAGKKILWNEGQWATVVGCGGTPAIPEISSAPNSNRANIIATAKSRFRAGQRISGGCRANLCPHTLTSSEMSSMRFNEKGNLLAGSVLIWSKNKGWACC